MPGSSGKSKKVIVTNKKAASIDELVVQFESIKGYFIRDKKLCCFVKKEPFNVCLQTVTEKVGAIGSPALWQNGEQQTVAKHILALHIDDRLNKGDRGLIGDLSNIKVSFSDYDLLHFFSRYCCVHQPEHFAIYSSSTLKIIQSKYSNFEFTGKESYEDYWKGVNLILNDLDITMLNYFCAEKFFWLYEYQLLNS
mgnify:CR=1 FL=1|jgi:hypothetical protein